MRLLTIIVKLNYYSDYFVVILFVISPWSSTTVVHPPSGSGCCTNTYIFILTSFSHFGLVANESARHPPWRVTINNTLFHCTRHPRLRTTTASTHFTSVSHVHEQKLGRRRLHTLKSLLSLHIWSLKCFPLRHSSCSEPPVDSNVTSFVKCEKNSIKEEEKLGLGGEKKHFSANTAATSLTFQAFSFCAMSPSCGSSGQLAVSRTVRSPSKLLKTFKIQLRQTLLHLQICQVWFWRHSKPQLNNRVKINSKKDVK